MSTRGDYAARALLSLALHATERPTSVKEIAERTHLPQPYLEQILLSVKGAGLVRSKRGVGGGYVLARPPEEITLADIVAAVEGPQIMLAEHPDHCEGHCILQEVWVGVDDESRRILERVTLFELVERTRVGHPDAAPDVAPDPVREPAN
jgi:Rrf2 family iron-sulfur cluster assembly transcriptional regulator